MIKHYNGNAKLAGPRERLSLLMAHTDTAAVELLLALVDLGWAGWFLVVPTVMSAVPVLQKLASLVDSRWFWGALFLASGAARAVALYRCDVSTRKSVGLGACALWLVVAFESVAANVASPAVPTTLVLSAASAWLYWRLPCTRKDLLSC